MDRAREWGIRIAHEAKYHEENSFVTLTYRDEDLPYDAGLQVRDLQLFFKRFREQIEPQKLRHFSCGEYGGVGNRPHYHCIVFGFGFPDKTLWRKTKSGSLSYRSAFLEKLWPFGHSEVGSVSAQSGAYVARYVLKKRSGAVAEEYYTRVHPVTGVAWRVAPEFNICSTRPGIGARWFDDWHSECFPSGYLVSDGKKVPVPRYYKKKSEYLTSTAKLKVRARKYSRDHAADLTDERCATRGEVQELRQAAFKRDLGEG